MGVADKRKKDQEMAARMKKNGEKRDVARCPICNKVVGVNQLQVHISYHPA
jgi:hypothetical protein